MLSTYVGGSASWCFRQTHWLLGFVRVFGNECPLLRFVHQTLSLKWISLQCWVFWDEACRMVSLQWLEPFDGCQWLVVSVSCLIAYSFCWDPSDFRLLGWISLLGNVLFLAICLWHWYHSLFVTIVRFLGSLMAQGSVLGGCVSCWVPEATPCVCDDVVKTENLDWIFLLDVSLLLRLACGRISIVEYVRWFDLYVTY